MSLIEVLLATVVIAITSTSALHVWTASVQTMHILAVEMTASAIAASDAQRIMDHLDIQSTVLSPNGIFSVQNIEMPSGGGHEIVVVSGNITYQLYILNDNG